MSVIIGLDTFGIFSYENLSPTSTTNYFTSAKLMNCIVDELYISKNGTIIDSSLKDWAIDTYLKAQFKNDLEAGNVSLGGLTIDQWKIRRRKVDSIKYQELSVVPTGNDENFYFLDTTPQSSVIYEYEISPMSGDIQGTAQTVQIQVDFEYWWLSDSEEAYPLFLNLQVSDIATNVQRHVYEGFNEYPIVSYGTQKYQSGTITTIVADVYLEMKKAYRDKVEDFINNKKPKYLKSPKGDIWKIDTHTSKRSPYINLKEDVSTITFDWMETGKIDD